MYHTILEGRLIFPYKKHSQMNLPQERSKSQGLRRRKLTFGLNDKLQIHHEHCQKQNWRYDGIEYTGPLKHL